MKLYILPLFSILAFAINDAAQVQLASDNYFPPGLEFRELQKPSSEESFDNPALLSKVNDGRLFLDVGFDNYARRIYKTKDLDLSIEVATLQDFRAAYSLLTLLRNSNIQEGPPGDAFTATADSIRFVQGRIWVRIQGRGPSEDLLRRVANSMSHRIGPIRKSPPKLVAHLPKLGYDASSLRYFPGSKSYEFYSGANADRYLKSDSDMEIAQARYSLENHSGILSLLSFPTPEVAEAFFSDLDGSKSVKKGANEVYAKRAGPLVALLEGAFDPGSADKILSSIRFSYSVQWIYEKHDRPATVWGVPAGILGTVVKSLFFVVLLCAISIVAGASFAVFRFVLRVYAPRNPLDRPERTEMTRLRLR